MPSPDGPSTPSFESYRKTLAPIFHHRPNGFDSPPETWDRPIFIARLRQVISAVTLDRPPLGFDYFASDGNGGSQRVVLVWRGATPTAFSGRGESVDLAFLDATAKAYADGYYRKFLEWPLVARLDETLDAPTPECQGVEKTSRRSVEN